MKIFKLIRSIPFLLSLTVILLLNINNQKQDTNLRILIWNTPSLPLATYLTISSATGFFISYIITTNLSRDSQLNLKKELKYRVENSNDESNLNQEIINEIPYDNTFIERDVKDPSPTINASFRIIGKTNSINQSLRNSQYKNDSPSDFSDETDTEYFEQEINIKNDNVNPKITNDWVDDSYLYW